ncbi:hypothetical protein, partial [Staphylococcus aureus]|uniref:hypothetical protein n=1 Tax=Staphylococcus aureus TaxID=1280 RepID=UPI0038B27026
MTWLRTRWKSGQSGWEHRCLRDCGEKLYVDGIADCEDSVWPERGLRDEVWPLCRRGVWPE